MPSGKITQFSQEDEGGITVDWIILTVSLIGLAIVVGASFQAGKAGLAANVVTYVTGYSLY